MYPSPPNRRCIHSSFEQCPRFNISLSLSHTLFLITAPVVLHSTYFSLFSLATGRTPFLVLFANVTKLAPANLAPATETATTAAVALAAYVSLPLSLSRTFSLVVSFPYPLILSFKMGYILTGL